MDEILETGEISSDGNRIIWKIPINIMPSPICGSYIYSPKFSTANKCWRLHLYLNWDCVFEFGVHQLKETEVRVRFGIIRKQGEFSICSTLNNKVNAIDLISEAELWENLEEWLPEEHLSLIFSVLESRKSTLQTICTQTFTDIDVRKLQRDLEFLLDGNVSDVTVKVKDTEFKSHRCILAARSPVFLAMMTHDTKENSSGVINIADADPEKFSDFLHYLYTGSVANMTFENVLDLYTISDKYQVTELQNSCVRYMRDNIKIETFCDVICLSLTYGEKTLTEVCIEFFKETWNSLEIIKTPKWQEFMSEHPIECNELFIKLLESKKS